MMPWLRSTMSIISAKKSFSSATVSPAGRVRVIAVKPRMSRNSTQTSRISLGGSVCEASSRSTTAGETCWPNMLVMRSRAAAAATDLSNCRRRLPATMPAIAPAASSTTLRLRW